MGVRLLPLHAAGARFFGQQAPENALPDVLSRSPKTQVAGQRKRLELPHFESLTVSSRQGDPFEHGFQAKIVGKTHSSV